jgi:hypothetical protein
MRLDEMFNLDEGAADASFRQKAEKVYNKLLQELKADPEIFIESMSTTENTMNFSTMLEHDPARLMLYVVYTPGPGDGSYTPANEEKGLPARIIISIHDEAESIARRKKSSKQPNGWKFSMVAYDLIADPKFKSVFTHEYVHHMDVLRKKGTLPTSNRKISSSEYYRNPLEQNAYMQEIFSDIENEAKLRPQEWMLLPHGEFYKKVLAYAQKEHPNFVKALGKKQLPHFKKRVMQLWQDLEEVPE